MHVAVNETSSLSSVPAPKIHVKLRLPSRTILEGHLTALQCESIVFAVRLPAISPQNINAHEYCDQKLKIMYRPRMVRMYKYSSEFPDMSQLFQSAAPNCALPKRTLTNIFCILRLPSISCAFQTVCVRAFS